MEKDTTKGLSKVIRIDESEIRGHLDKMVKGTVENTLNALLEAEADEMCNAQRYERSAERIDARAGHYKRMLHTKATDVVAKLRSMKLKAAAELVENSIHETFAFYASPPQHWIKLKTNNPMERLLKEARRRTKVVGAFPDGYSALMLVAARLRHVSAAAWGTRKYMNMRLLDEMNKDAIYSVA